MAERSYQKNRSAERDRSRSYQKTRGSLYDNNLESLMESQPSWEFDDPSEELGFPVDGKFKPISEMSDSELRSHEILYKRSGEPVPSMFRGNLESLIPFNPTSLAFNTLILGAAQEKPLAAAIGGLLAPSAFRMAGNLGMGNIAKNVSSEMVAPFRPLKEAAGITSEALKSIPRNIRNTYRFNRAFAPDRSNKTAVRNALSALRLGSRSSLREASESAKNLWSPSLDVDDAHDFINPADFQGQVANLVDHFQSTGSASGSATAQDVKLPQVIELHDQEARSAYKAVRFDGSFGSKNDLEYDWVDRRGSAFEFKMSRREDDISYWTPQGPIEIENTKYYLKSTAPYIEDTIPGGSAYIEFDVANTPVLDKKGNVTSENISVFHNFHFHSRANLYGERPTGRLQAGKLLLQFMKKLPDRAIIDESTLTIDSFLNLINTAIKGKSTLVFKDENLDPSTWFRVGYDYRQSSSMSRESGVSVELQKAHEEGNIKKVEKIWDNVLEDISVKIGRYSEQTGLVKGDPDFQIRPRIGGYSGAEKEYDKQEFELTYNNLQIQKLLPVVVGALGFKNMNAFKDYLEYDTESVESKVFDQEISF